MNFKDKVVYQIYPKSFHDSNGDGLGDIQGIIEKLDYLKELGIDYIWSTPFFVSPQNDNGYDVADYYNIDPGFGTMEDVEALIEKADKCGIGLMFDMVFNHTSTAHEWFQKALTGDPKYMDYYIFKESREIPTNWVSKFGGPAWEYVPSLDRWYLHLFDLTQADLNWENPKVREELKNVIRFWKKKGVKGFRFDVVNLISKPEKYEDDTIGDGRRFYTDGHHVHEFLKELVEDTQIQDLVTVGEMSSTSIENCIRYSNPDEKELSMCFNFHHLKVDYKDGNKWELMKPDYGALKRLFVEWQMGMQKNNGWNSVFWCNHDQPRIVSRFGDVEKYWKESAKMWATTIHMMKGTPYIYQGEELGMTNAGYTKISQYRDVESLNYFEILQAEGKTKEEAIKILAARSRDNSRTPMQWSSAKNAGFSDASPWILPAANYVDINVEAEKKDPDSILQYYKELIRLRKEYPAVSEGEIAFVMEEVDALFAFTRIQGEQKLLVMNNWSGDMLQIEMEDGYRKIFGNYEGCKLEEAVLQLRPYESVVFQKN